ncbi:MAG: hypothetical protein V4671_29165 [Armatimonadota bacterium]
MTARTTPNRDLELDSGGFGRLDISDLADPAPDSDRGVSAAAPRACDWCEEAHSSGGDYLVVADNRHFLICPTCWGRSAAYVELRQYGVTHDTALGKLIAS